jgi:hypothetical protein
MRVFANCNKDSTVTYQIFDFNTLVIFVAEEEDNSFTEHFIEG